MTEQDEIERIAQALAKNREFGSNYSLAEVAWNEMKAIQREKQEKADRFKPHQIRAGS